MCKIRWLTRWKEIKKGYKKQYKIMVKISGLKMKMDSLNDVLELTLDSFSLPKVASKLSE